MRTEQKEEPDDVHLEIDVEGRTWIVEGDHSSVNGVSSKVDALARKFGDGGEIRIDVTMTDPVYKSWSFYVRDEEWPEIEEKLDEFEEQDW